MFTKKNVTLLPCPFCGNKDIQYVYYEDNNNNSFVMCGECGASISNVDCLPENDCAVLWNKRTKNNTN